MVKNVEIETEESYKEISSILTDYYNNLYIWLKKYSLIHFFNFNKDDPETVIKSAFIKAVSRPFFIFYLRKRQAAFHFCIKELSNLLENPEYNKNNLIKVHSFCKALTDMNANYLIRNPQNQIKPFDELFKYAQFGDKYIKSINGEDPSTKKKFFDSNKLRMCYKKMMSLTQDTSKSLLLEHVLLFGGEESFWGVLPKDIGKYYIDQFIKFEKDHYVLSTKGLIYVDNNRIIMDAFKDFGRRNTEIMRYYFENYRHMCLINGLDQRQSADSSIFLHQNDFIKKLFEHEKNERKKNGPKIQLEDLGNFVYQFSELWGISTKAVFIHDINVEKNTSDINKLFEFLLLNENERNEEEQKEFFRDSVFEKIRHLNISKNEEDVILVEKTEEDNKGCYDVYVRIGTERNNEIDKGIYFWFSNFNKKEIKHFFFLKIFLSFRDKIVDIIEKSNMKAVVLSRSEAQRERALSISKSLTHANSQRYMNLKFGENGEDDFEKAKSKYHLLISNEWISSIYRKIIRDGNNQSDSLYEELVTLYGDELEDWEDASPFSFGEVIQLSDVVAEKLSNYNNKKIYLIYEKKIYLAEIIVKGLEYCKEFQEVSILPKIGDGLMAIELVIPLMVENMIHHSGGSETLYVEITDTGDLIFENEAKKEGKEAEKEKEKIRECMDIYPWVYRGCSVTLWTMKHAINDLNKIILRYFGGEDPIVRMSVEETNNHFKVIIYGYFRRR